MSSAPLDAAKAVSSRPPGAVEAHATPWAWIRAHPKVFLALLSLAFFVPGTFSLPPLDRDESRFAQASKQMLETGDFINIRFLQGARNKKPAGIHWMQSFTAWLAGGPEKAGIWAYRMPSAIGALIAVLLLHWAACRLFDPDTALMGAALLAASLGLMAETNIAKTDGVLIATVIAMQGVLIRFYLKARGAERPMERTRPDWLPYVFWVALGISILIKGPIAPMVIGLTIVAISLADRDWTWMSGLRWKIGTAIVLLLVLPWGLSIWVTTSGVYYEESVGKDLMAKVFSAQESHGGPPGYYLALVTISFFPGSLFLWPSVWHAWRMRVAPQFRYLLAWAIPSWIAFECFPTKLPHYTLPTYPALALMTGAVIMIAMRGRADWLTGPLARANLVAWTLVGIAIASFATLAPVWMGDGLPAIGPWLSAAGIILVLIAAQYAWRTHFLHAMRTGIAAALVLFVSVLEITLPNLDHIAVSRKITEKFECIFGEDHLSWPPIASTGYVEPSLVFMTSTSTRLVKPETAAEFLTENPTGIALIEQRKLKKVMEKSGELGIALETFETVRGRNYSNGQDVTIRFYQRAGTGYRPCAQGTPAP